MLKRFQRKLYSTDKACCCGRCIQVRSSMRGFQTNRTTRRYMPTRRNIPQSRVPIMFHVTSGDFTFRSDHDCKPELLGMTSYILISTLNCDVLMCRISKSMYNFYNKCLVKSIIFIIKLVKYGDENVM